MSRLILRYADNNLNVLDYDEEAEDQLEFQCLKLFPKEIINNVNAGNLLNGRQFSHNLFNVSEINLTISTNELSDENLEFLKNFWTSNYKYYSLINGVTISNYKKCITNGGRFPVTYIDENINFPELSFILRDCI